MINLNGNDNLIISISKLSIIINIRENLIKSKDLIIVFGKYLSVTIFIKMVYPYTIEIWKRDKKRQFITYKMPYRIKFLSLRRLHSFIER